MNHKQPQKPDQCVNHLPGLKCKASARLDTTNETAGFSPCGVPRNYTRAIDAISSTNVSIEMGSAKFSRIQYGDGVPHSSPVTSRYLLFDAGGPAGMKRFLRLLRYGLPYTLQWFPGVILLAIVGVLDTFRTLLFQPIFDQVLRPDAPEGPITLGLTNSRWHFDLRTLIPHFMHMHNAWSVVAFALVISTLAKGLCDYLGTYLVNYAGFGTITDLRNHLYEVTMRRSASFFHKHPTGTILSTLINDVDRVQTALSSVIGEFLQQFFTFVAGLR